MNRPNKRHGLIVVLGTLLFLTGCLPSIARMPHKVDVDASAELPRELALEWLRSVSEAGDGHSSACRYTNDGIHDPGANDQLVPFSGWQTEHIQAELSGDFAGWYRFEVWEHSDGKKELFAQIRLKPSSRTFLGSFLTLKTDVNCTAFNRDTPAPSSSEIEKARKEMEKTLAALVSLGVKVKHP